MFVNEAEGARFQGIGGSQPSAVLFPGQVQGETDVHVGIPEGVEAEPYHPGRSHGHLRRVAAFDAGFFDFRLLDLLKLHLTGLVVGQVKFIYPRFLRD